MEIPILIVFLIADLLMALKQALKFDKAAAASLGTATEKSTSIQSMAKRNAAYLCNGLRTVLIS